MRRERSREISTERVRWCKGTPYMRRKTADDGGIWHPVARAKAYKTTIEDLKRVKSILTANLRRTNALLTLMGK